MSTATEQAKDTLRPAVERAAAAATATPATNATPSDAPIIASAVLSEVAPILVNKTNNEPWYQSRVTWGAIASIALPVLGVVGVTADVMDSDQFVALGMAAGTVVGGLLTLYGRWKAKKPIGA